MGFLLLFGLKKRGLPERSIHNYYIARGLNVFITGFPRLYKNSFYVTIRKNLNHKVSNTN